MCRLQFYRNMQKKSTNPSIRTLVSFLQRRLLRVFRILPYAQPANPGGLFFYIVRQKKRNDGIIGSGKKCFAKFIIT